MARTTGASSYHAIRGNLDVALNRGRMAEWDEAETAAWRVPGGKEVENRLILEPYTIRRNPGESRHHNITGQVRAT